jgi:predicted Holliday junction resolvase-like endonuclease
MRAIAPILAICIVIVALMIIVTKIKKVENKPNLKQINDSLVNVLKQKDSVLNLKETLYNDKKTTDSIQLNSINNSIKNLRYEIKKQSNQVYSTPDSLFQQYIDSIRTAKGFNKIQYNGK